MNTIPDRTTLGRYDIAGEIGKGNMATVYLGHDVINHRDVALKVANPEMLRDESSGQTFRTMFLNEAKLAGVLKHPNIVSVYDAGFEDDICYLAMEYINGSETLHGHCDASTLLPIEDVVQIIFKSAKALDHAHRHGIIHRDVKPANILLTENGDVKLADFGVAIFTRCDDMAATQLTGYAGSPLYMAPEQITQPDVTTQVDLFSLGLVMYEMLTGKHPFYANTIPAVAHRIINEPHVPISQSRAETPDILEAIVRKLLKKSPEDRYKTGLDVAADLSSVFEHLSLSEQDISDREKFNLVRDLEFFTNFSEPEIWEVINASTWAEFQPGETMIYEGQLDNSFYILVSGDATVRKGEVDVYSLTRGECFGEIGFITREKRTANVVANSSVWVMKISPPLIENASAVCQLRFHKEFLSTLANRLRIMTEKVI